MEREGGWSGEGEREGIGKLKVSGGGVRGIGEEGEGVRGGRRKGEGRKERYPLLPRFKPCRSPPTQGEKEGGKRLERFSLLEQVWKKGGMWTLPARKARDRRPDTTRRLPGEAVGQAGEGAGQRRRRGE